MKNRRRQLLPRGERPNRGQVALEYALTSLTLIALASLLWVFYQGFVSGNLYGGLERDGARSYALSEGNASLGFERAVSLPFP